MKKQFVLSIIIIIYTTLNAQTETEVFLIEIKIDQEKIELASPKNISNNKGYDNQPSFYDTSTLLFSSTRNRQTDIALYNIQEKTTSWITETALGSEYSPLKIPGKESVSAIRLDTTGLQRLYEYKLENGTPVELLKNLKVGYHVWYNKDILVSSVLVDDQMNLVISNLIDHTNDTIQNNVGRSLHKIPNSDLISFISKKNDVWSINAVHPLSKELKQIVTIPSKIEDMCWLQNGTILIGQDNMIKMLNPKTDKDWHTLHIFKEKSIKKISRISISSNQKYIAIVSE